MRGRDARVYQAIAGRAVTAEAVCASSRDREDIAATARDAGVSFTGFSLDGPPKIVARRLREHATDASDATVDMLQFQRRSDVGRLD